MSHPIDLWLTAGSTYTYLTIMRCEAVAERQGVALRLRPFYLGDIFKDTGFWPFHPGTSRTAYMWRDIERRAEELGLTPSLPAPYPAPNTPLANRIAQIAVDRGVGLPYLRASYEAWFSEGRPAGEPENVRPSLSAVGLDPDEILSAAEDPATEAALQAATDEARRLGVFGSPTFAVGPELFWGDDRLEDAIAWARKTAPP